MNTSAVTKTPSGTTIGKYLIDQLERHGVRHVFGIPGDYSLLFLKEMSESAVTFVGTSDEQGAGAAADAYARLNGLGAVCITYAVGSLKVANATAQAFAERSPVIVICGAPGLEERIRHPLLHHRVNQFDTQQRIFKRLTVAWTVLDEAETAFSEIDRVIHAAERHKRPVYIELPRDMVHVEGAPGHRHVDVPEVSDPAVLSEALTEAADMINSAKHPVIVAGEEIQRFGLSEKLVELVKKTGIPVAATLLGKSCVSEDEPSFLGVYAGVLGSEETRCAVESGDCFVLLGMMMTDLNLGAFTANLDRAKTILANVDGVFIRHHSFDVRFPHLLDGLLSAPIRPRHDELVRRSSRPGPFLPRPGMPITVQRLVERLDTFVTDEMVVLADVGDSLFGSVGLHVRREGHYLSSAYYASMGFGVPGSVGVQMLDRRLRPLVLVGDGAFQMTGMELSTAARLGLSPIVIVLNNGGYATERFFMDGTFNDIHPWNHAAIPSVLGAGKGFIVRNEEELDGVLQEAYRNTGSFSIVDVRLKPDDVSDGLRRLGASLRKTVRG